MVCLAQTQCHSRATSLSGIIIAALLLLRKMACGELAQVSWLGMVELHKEISKGSPHCISSLKLVLLSPLF